MTKAESQGVVFPLPASYRANDPALSDTSPANIRQILTNARNGQLWDQERLYRAMLDTWPRFVKNLAEFQGAIAGLELVIEPAKREGREEPAPQAVRMHDIVSRSLNNYAPRPGHWELGLKDAIKAIVEAYVKGIQVLEIVWHVQNDIASPRCFAPVPGKYLAFPSMSNEVDRLMLAKNGVGTSTLEDFPANKFVVAIWGKGGVHPVYSANLRPLSKYWLASVYGLGWLMQYGQLFGIPWRHVKTDGTEDSQSKAEALLENIGATGWAITTNGVELSVLDGVSGSSESLPQSHMMEVADKQCDIMLLGQSLTTDVGDSGSRALGDVHAGVRKERLQDVADWVASIITDQLIPAIVEMNFGKVAPEDMPYCQLRIPETKDDKAIAERVKILKEIGVEMPLQWVHDTLGVPVPVDGEAVFGGEEMGDDQEQIEPDWLDEDEGDEDDSGEYNEAEAAYVQAKAKGGSIPKKAKAKKKLQRGSSKIPTNSGGGFDPNQKRIPKGRPDAGRWTDDGIISKGQRARKGVMRPATDEDRKRLRIPPGLKDAKVTDDPKADLLGTAINSKGEPVPFYSDSYNKKQEAAKYARIAAINKEMPALRSKIDADSKAGNHQALTMRLIAQTGMRNGGDKGGGKVKAYGASNLRTDHVKVSGDTISMDFIGKKGVRQRQSVTDPILAKHAKARIMEGRATVFDGNSEKTYRYLQKISNNSFKVHDFRTWTATVTADRTIKRIAARSELPTTEAEFKDFQMRVARVVSRRLGNDPAMALKAYIHPAVFHGY